METTSPKKTDTGGGGGTMAPKTTTTPTSANGKKLVQARLPFKTLGGGALTVDPARAAPAAGVATTERRKRKLSKTGTVDDAERAPKLNRIEAGNLVANDLLSTEVLDESVDYSMTDRKSIGKSEVKSMKMKSESKENVDGNERKLDNNDDDVDDDDVLEIDDSSGGGSNDDIDLTEPKAKKSLDMNPDTKRSKRTNDDNLITIKLPMTKKAKETSKKSKKGKNEIDSRLECANRLIRHCEYPF